MATYLPSSFQPLDILPINQSVSQSIKCGANQAFDLHLELTSLSQERLHLSMVESLSFIILTLLYHLKTHPNHFVHQHYSKSELTFFRNISIQYSKSQRICITSSIFSRPGSHGSQWLLKLLHNVAQAANISLSTFTGFLILEGMVSTSALSPLCFKNIDPSFANFISLITYE